jgi:hypothetical protein
MYREMDMGFWLEQAEPELRRLAWDAAPVMSEVGSLQVREAQCQPQPNGIGSKHHDDRDGLGRLLSHQRFAGSQRDDNIYVKADQLGRHGFSPIEVSHRVPDLDGHVLAFDPAPLAETLAEGGEESREPSRGWSRVAIQQHAYPVDLPGRLRLGGKRRGVEAEVDLLPVAHSVTWSARRRGGEIVRT